ncbi:MAG TPA: hypothetical protein VEV17_07820 [Bryobacteraceae bacterium]|nr:hypothetical protein [Bryobacteraceae bacterium]
MTVRRSQKTTIWVGTRKGAFVFRSSDRKSWDIEGPLFPGAEINHIIQDPRNPKLTYAAAWTTWFGPHLQVTSNGGKTWNLSEAGLEMKCVPDTSLKRIWCIQPGHQEQPGVVWLGGEPGALFRSDDWGRSWSEVASLTAHPTRPQWTPAMGSITLHCIQCPRKDRIIAAISVGGVFRSNDGGASWSPFNGHVLADFQPQPVKYPEIGQCVHKLLAHPADPDMLYQQNHCGVYRARSDAKNWTNITRGLPTRFGFGLALPAAEEKTLFTVPMDSVEFRCNPEGRFRVACSRDGGKKWELLGSGLPQKHAHLTVLREGMCADSLSPPGVYVGTVNGTLFHSRDSGKKWQVLAEYLPAILSVSASVE